MLFHSDRSDPTCESGSCEQNDKVIGQADATTAFLDLVLNDEQAALDSLTLPGGFNPGVSLEFLLAK